MLLGAWQQALRCSEDKGLPSHFITREECALVLHKERHGGSCPLSFHVSAAVAGQQAFFLKVVLRVHDADERFAWARCAWSPNRESTLKSSIIGSVL
jgi:hypothetical protein